MKKNKYVHVMLDPSVNEPDGQLICNHCKLEGTDATEVWENFLNGQWTKDHPIKRGFYPVLVTDDLISDIDHFASPYEGWVEWDDSMIVYRWSEPFPVGALPNPGEADE
jgi:hypothetical protein